MKSSKAKKKAAKVKTQESTAPKIGAMIDRIMKAQLEHDKLAAKAEAKKAAIGRLKDELQVRFKKDSINGAAGKIGKAVVMEEDVPTLEDYDSLCKFVKANDAFDLLQKRVSPQAWRDRLANGVNVPGVTKFHKVTLRVVARTTSASKKAA